MLKRKLKKWILIIFGLLSLSLGVIGIFVPILPTTPFLLLSAACFIRSSKKLYEWLLNNRIFGNYIKIYFEYKAITLKSKILTLVLLWAVILLTIFLKVHSFLITILLIIIAIGVTIHILHIKTFRGVPLKNK